MVSAKAAGAAANSMAKETAFTGTSLFVCDHSIAQKAIHRDTANRTSPLGHKQPFSPGQPGVRFAPIAVIRLSAMRAIAIGRFKMRRTIALATALVQFDLGL